MLQIGNVGSVWHRTPIGIDASRILVTHDTEFTRLASTPFPCVVVDADPLVLLEGRKTSDVISALRV